MLGYWPYAWKYFFWYICIFVTLRRKPGILNTRFVFLQYKNTKKTTKKIHKKQRYYSFFFLGAGSSAAQVAGLNPAGIAGSLAQTSDPAGQKLTRALAGYCSSELNFTWTVTMQPRMHAKLVRKERQLTWSAGEPDFFRPHCLRSPAVLSRLCSFRFILLPFLFSPSPPFCFPFSQ